LSEILGVFFIFFGLFFAIVGVYGLIRFPDVYSRIHSSGKVSTMGLLGLIIASAFLLPETTLKIVALVGFLLMTAPVASHMIANAAHRTGVRPENVLRDDLSDDPMELESAES